LKKIFLFFKGPNLIENNNRLIINGELQCRALWHGQLQWTKSSGLLIYLFDQTIVLCKRDVLRRSNLIFKERMGMTGTTIYDLHDGKGLFVYFLFLLHIPLEDVFLLYFVG
jgi:hypothetical protein